MFFLFRKKIIWYVGIGLLLLFVGGYSYMKQTSPQSTNVKSEEMEKIIQMNQLAGEFYNKAVASEFTEARALLTQISTLATQIHFNGMTSLEGVHALSDRLVQAKKVYNGVKMSPDEMMLEAAKIRLITDALTHPNEPMWKQYYKLINENLNELEQAANHKMNQEAVNAIANLQGHYQLIRPSLLIHQLTSEVEKLDSLLGIIAKQLQANPAEYEKVLTQIKYIKQSMDDLFQKRETKTAYLPIIDSGKSIFWTFLVGMLIVMVLSFAGWRMFHSTSYVRVHRK